MSDSSVAAWARGLLEHDARAFEEARKRFVRHPTAKRLHALRTAARRLRSLLADVGDVHAIHHAPKLVRIVKRTGKARDAAVLRATLCDALDERERDAAEPLLRALRARERAATRVVCKKLQRFRLRLACAGERS